MVLRFDGPPATRPTLPDEEALSRADFSKRRAD
jgi:hypothetical protein